MRRSLADVLKTTKIDLLQEYNRLYKLFYSVQEDDKNVLINECQKNFLKMPFRGTCLSLSDFNYSYGLVFEEKPKNFDLNYLVLFCEYTYNLVIHVFDSHCAVCKSFYIKQMNLVLDLIDYKFISDKDIKVKILVPKTPEALAVAEIVDEKIAYSVLEYNHHSLEGDLLKKKMILKLIADDIELQRKTLSGINKTLADNLFQMLQKFVRHNNEDNPYIKGLSSDELEACYDDIYQMWLLAKLEIDNMERKKRVEETLREINA